MNPHDLMRMIGVRLHMNYVTWKRTGWVFPPGSRNVFGYAWVSFQSVACRLHGEEGEHAYRKERHYATHVMLCVTVDRPIIILDPEGLGTEG